MVQDCDWYFDVVSPFSYIQWAARGRFADRVRLRPIPIVLGAVLSHWEQKGPAESPPKRFHTYRAAQWRADKLGLSFRFPPAHPFNPIAALRLIVVLDACDEAVDAVFGAAFRDGQDISDVTVLETIGQALGLANVREAIGRPEVKQQLCANTDAAIARGVFGVPTTVTKNGELFWGEDMTALMLDYLDDPTAFDTLTMRRLRTLPIGVERRAK
jgi:2-hydroxychromene-2-carboxylate isomerase